MGGKNLWGCPVNGATDQLEKREWETKRNRNFRAYGEVQSTWPQSQGCARMRMLSTYLKTEVGDEVVPRIAGWNVSNLELGWCKRRERENGLNVAACLYYGNRNKQTEETGKNSS